MVLVKICGLCRAEDAVLAAEAGADYLGVVLAPGGRRSRTIGQAAAIFGAAPAIRRVGVFVDEDPVVVREAVERLGLHVVQLHGEEPPGYVEALVRRGGPEIWKAIRPRDEAEFLAGVAAYGNVAHGILLDGWSAHAAGGTGARFPWDVVARVRDALAEGIRLIVAGGLEPENVRDAVRRLRPGVVDVSSGVEARIGEKSPERVEAFVAAARTDDASHGMSSAS